MFDLLTVAVAAASLTTVLTALFAVHCLSKGFGAKEESSAFSTILEMNHLHQAGGELTHSHAENAAADVSLFQNRLILPNADLSSDLASKVEQSHDISDGPKIAWLMSFPNSGTSFTLHLTRESSNMTTASNYALEGEIKDKPSVPIRSHMGETGPWLELIPNKTTTVPHKYILTKTHCSGFCNHCAPQRYLETTRSFQLSCQTGTRGDFHRAHKVNKTELRVVKIPRSKVTYDASAVASAIHVIRNPFDNVVARFHLDYNREVNVFQNSTYAEIYPNNATGFHRWCEYYDRAQASQPGSRWLDGHVLEKMKHVKCRQEFLQYLQWHNLAFASTREMHIPTLVLYYEDYSEDLDLTRDRILSFLELPKTDGGIEFEPGKSYIDYYSEKQRWAVRELFSEYATVETWDRTKHYLE